MNRDFFKAIKETAKEAKEKERLRIEKLNQEAEARKTQKRRTDATKGIQALWAISDEFRIYTWEDFEWDGNYLFIQIKDDEGKDTGRIYWYKKALDSHWRPTENWSLFLYPYRMGYGGNTFETWTQFCQLFTRAFPND